MTNDTEYLGFIHYDIKTAIRAAQYKANLSKNPTYVYDCTICMGTDLFMVLTHEGRYGELRFKAEPLNAPA